MSDFKEVYFTFYDRMAAESQRLKAQIESLQSQLDKFPDGKLLCARNGERMKWYHSDGKTKTYIPKEEQKYAEQLAVKKYLSCILQEAVQKKRAVDLYLRYYPSDPGKAERLLTENSEYQKLLSPYFKKSSQELLDWASSPYDHNTIKQERLIHKTSSGNLVRSKSEALIDYVLYTNKIPFRYECALQLGSAIIYPDFTIRHPETGEYYYWEHFGMMDRPEYSSQVGAKLQLYISNGIIPSIRLITTYETLDKPLSTEEVERIVKLYFL